MQSCEYCHMCSSRRHELTLSGLVTLLGRGASATFVSASVGMSGGAAPVGFAGLGASVPFMRCNVGAASGGNAELGGIGMLVGARGGVEGVPEP